MAPDLVVSLPLIAGDGCPETDWLPRHDFWTDATLCVVAPTVVVLEARDRVGGRTWSISLPDGTQVDRGGTWFGPGQDAAYMLAEKMVRTTYPSWDEGDGLIMLHGKPVRADAGPLLRINPFDLANVVLAATELDEMAREVPLDAPWEATRAAEWDATTLGGWVDDNLDPGPGRQGFEATLTDIFTSVLDEVSLLGALHLIHSNAGLARLTSSKGGHQQDRVLGGTQSIVNAIHDRLGDAVRLASPVRDISGRSPRRTDPGLTAQYRASAR